MPFTKSTNHLHPVATTPQLSGRQRLFYNRVAGGSSGAEAARQAVYSGASAPQQAWRLLQNPHVKMEIERVSRPPALRGQAELDRMLTKVESVYAKAIRDGQCAPALRAVEIEALLRQNGARTLPENVTPDELASAAGELSDTNMQRG